MQKCMHLIIVLSLTGVNLYSENSCFTDVSCYPEVSDVKNSVVRIVTDSDLTSGFTGYVIVPADYDFSKTYIATAAHGLKWANNDEYPEVGDILGQLAYVFFYEANECDQPNSGISEGITKNDYWWGEAVASGMYLYMLTSHAFNGKTTHRQTNKMVLLK